MTWNEQEIDSFHEPFKRCHKSFYIFIWEIGFL
jgi:hypothetical protein